jgi:hypothetical protein
MLSIVSRFLLATKFSIHQLLTILEQHLVLLKEIIVLQAPSWMSLWMSLNVNLQLAITCNLDHQLGLFRSFSERILLM